MTSILIVNDVPGTGQVAGLTNLAIVNAAGYEATLLPTVYLTHHTGVGDVYRQSLDQVFEASLAAWQKTQFEAIVTGYFGNARQIQAFMAWYRTYQADTYLLVDPIMGDGGRLYRGIESDYVEAMQELVTLAHDVLPNLTEAYLLANQPLSELAQEDDQVALRTLVSGWQDAWLITGLIDGDRIGLALSAERLIWTERQPQNYFGTGDLFTSLFLVARLGGQSRQQAGQWSADLVSQAAHLTGQRWGESRREVYYQPLLPLISQTLRRNEE